MKRFCGKAQERTKNETLDIVNHQWQRLVRGSNLPGRVSDLLESGGQEIDPYTASINIIN